MVMIQWPLNTSPWWTTRTATDTGTASLTGASPWLSIVVAWHCLPEVGGAEIPIPLEVAEMRTYKILEVNAF